MIDVALLKKMCETPGAPGFETAIRNEVMSELHGLVDDVVVDNMGNLIATKKGTGDKSVMIAAHLDEIGFIVSHIDDDGFIRMHPLGGFDPKTLTAQRVIVHGKKDIIGVMGCKPIHLMSTEERAKPLQIKDYFIDTGLPKEEVEQIVEIGSSITRERQLIEMGDCVNSKSLDNRVSVFILLELFKRLKDKEVPFDIIGAFTVQEEVGLRGAHTAANGFDPDFAINLDVTIAYDVPGSQPQEQVSKLGNGTAIKILDGMTICDQRMVRFIKGIANKENIKWQPELLPAGGTDTAAMQRSSKGGSIAGAISIPCRNLHQVIEMCHKADVKASIDLLEKCVVHLDEFDYNF